MISMRKQILASMGPAMRCTVFGADINHTDFKHTQTEVNVSVEDFRPEWTKDFVEYSCSFTKQLDYDPSRPTAIIPIRGCEPVIEMCMSSMRKTQTLDLINVIIVDDRSEKSLWHISDHYGVSYLRVDYNSTFNFSMLCNIGAKICYDLGNTQVIMWNADLYVSDRTNLEKVISRHNQKKSSLSGAKLLYPTQEYSTTPDENTMNIANHFPQMAGKWRNTIQFGNGAFQDEHPYHQHRFEQSSNASVDTPSEFITGAFQMIELDKFIEVGGYNPSLKKSYQDVDISTNIDGPVWYFGNDVEFYHDESPVFFEHKTKHTEQNQSDQLIYTMMRKI
mgnify:CR=1 FL=1|tara:strand:- start:1834 stop:2835 length:1002 start_codon:yes stop_codon:yes gene_type:complete